MENWAIFINGIIWQVIVIFVVIYFRKSIKDLFGRLGRIKFRGVELDFSREFPKELADINEYVNSEPNLFSGKCEDANNLLEEVSQISEISPEAAIPFAYYEI